MVADELLGLNRPSLPQNWDQCHDIHLSPTNWTIKQTIIGNIRAMTVTQSKPDSLWSPETIYESPQIIGRWIWGKSSSAADGWREAFIRGQRSELTSFPHRSGRNRCVSGMNCSFKPDRMFSESRFQTDSDSLPSLWKESISLYLLHVSSSVL